jgi:hypothetical protein
MAQAVVVALEQLLQQLHPLVVLAVLVALELQAL